MIPCRECPVRQMPVFRPFTPEELAFVSRAKRAQLDFAARAQIVRSETADGRMYTILSGWAFRYKSLSGGIRQILDFLLPGDPIALQSPLTGKVRHDVAAVTPVTLCEIAGEPMREMFDEHPDLASAMMSTLLVDDDRADRRLLLLGRQRPTQRLAYLMLELRDRQIARRLAEEARCDFPLTYGLMADALGLSRAQLARSLAELRDRSWARLEGGTLFLDAAERMQEFCDYDAAARTQTRALI